MLIINEIVCSATYSSGKCCPTTQHHTPCKTKTTTTTLSTFDMAKGTSSSSSIIPMVKQLLVDTILHYSSSSPQFNISNSRFD